MAKLQDGQKIHIAVLISAHGFGHAARACAVLDALRGNYCDFHFEIFSEVPEWFIFDSLGGGFSYHRFSTDVGVIQTTPFDEDLQTTYLKLENMFSPENRLVDQLAQQIRQTTCKFALCDISPLGILAAGKAGIPSILVENFTWDWIYEGYLDKEPCLGDIIHHLESIFASASLHIQTEPICAPRRCDLVVRPVARQPRQSREQIRTQLGVRAEVPLVLITSGGIQQKFGAVDQLTSLYGNIHFVIPGSADEWITDRNVSLLPHHSRFFHPDLVFACDAVVGKLGYSTIAETYYAGVPFGYVPRPYFRETGPLANFVLNNLGGFEISLLDYDGNNGWLKDLSPLLEISRQARTLPNGSLEIAKYILEQVGLNDEVESNDH